MFVDFLFPFFDTLQLRVKDALDETLWSVLQSSLGPFNLATHLRATEDGGQLAHRLALLVSNNTASGDHVFLIKSFKVELFELALVVVFEFLFTLFDQLLQVSLANLIVCILFVDLILALVEVRILLQVCNLLLLIFNLLLKLHHQLLLLRVTLALNIIGLLLDQILILLLVFAGLTKVKFLLSNNLLAHTASNLKEKTGLERVLGIADHFDEGRHGLPKLIPNFEVGHSDFLLLLNVTCWHVEFFDVLVVSKSVLQILDLVNDDIGQVFKLLQEVCCRLIQL